MSKLKVAVVGGGAAGIAAAISAAKAGNSVVLCEKMKVPGKKVLASGGGRCNFMNIDMDHTFFHEAERGFVKNVFDRFGKDQILNFFREIGLFSYAAEDGRMFPISNRSQTVMNVLENELARVGVKVELEWDVDSIQARLSEFQLKSRAGKVMTADRVILCSGGRTYPALGSDGHGYRMAEALGHRVVEQAPITLPVVVKDRWCHFLQGVKVRGRAAAIVDGKMDAWIDGDILFTKYGLSGLAIFDCSDPVSIALHRGLSQDVQVAVDLVPFMTQAELQAEFERKLALGYPVETLLEGILAPKFMLVLGDYLKPGKTGELASLLKRRVFTVDQTRGWNEAEFTAGGVELSEVDNITLESKLQKGLYFAGEILNVQGKRGGYNLAWAWASGHIAGAAGKILA